MKNAESHNELMNNENSCEFPIILKFMFITTKKEDFFFLKCIAHFIIQRRKRIKKVNKQLHYFYIERRETSFGIFRENVKMTDGILL